MDNFGYYSDREFENVANEVVKSYCSSVFDRNENDLFGKDMFIQPYDFGTSRRTKRFFNEDYVNLTKAATDKEYAIRCYKKEIENDAP